MYNSFWKSVSVLGYTVKLDEIISVWGGIDPVSNWDSGYHASFSIDNCNTGFVNFEIANGTVSVSTVGAVKEVSDLVETLRRMCSKYPPRIGDWDDNPHAWG